MSLAQLWALIDDEPAPVEPEPASAHELMALANMTVA